MEKNEEKKINYNEYEEIKNEIKNKK